MFISILLFQLKIVIHWCTSHGYKLCSFCTNYAFKYDSDRIQHEQQHIPFGCTFDCEHEFNKICDDNISEHYKKAHQSLLCFYCLSVIQPLSKYAEHVEKKHNVLDFSKFSNKEDVYRLFELKNNGSELAQDSFFHCLMCDKKKRLNLWFGHYAFYHNISIHALKKALDLSPEMCINGSVLTNVEKDTSSSNDIEETGNTLKKELCTVCDHPFRFDEITKELHGVFCKGFVVCDQKDCSEVFETDGDLAKHMDLKHSVLNCKFGCAASTQLKPLEINHHMQKLHDLIECFLCNNVNSLGNFNNHLRDTHSVDLMTFEKAMAKKASSKLYRVESSSESDGEKQVLCNFCDHDITEEIKEFSFVRHYQNEHEINLTAILRNLDKNPIMDVILNDKKSKFDKECLKNFFIVKSFDSLIETDFDCSKVCCIGIEHLEPKPNISDFEEEMIDSEYTCEFCKKTFKFAKPCEFYEHLQESHGFRLLNVNACDKCKTQNKSTETLTSQDNKNFNLSLVCPYDSSSHVTKENFKDHMRYAHSDSTPMTNVIIYKCHVCNYAYKSMKEIRDHFNNDHPNIKMKYCRICRFKLTSDESSDHFRLKHAEDMKRIEKFCCKICKKEFKKEGTAKLHYVKTHKKQEEKRKSAFKCQNPQCRESFDNKEDRKLHQLFAHPDEKMFACKQCDLKFSTKSSLSSHTVIHKNVINTCEFCSKTFLRRDSFKEHLLIHSDVRLKCSYCEKVFVQRSNLIRHERIHLNDKPYKCTYCDKTFSDKGACTSHEKVHTKSEICQCGVCGKEFQRKQKLKYHMRLHTLENVLTCEDCGKIFPENYSYRKHRETHQNKGIIKVN